MVDLHCKRIILAAVLSSQGAKGRSNRAAGEPWQGMNEAGRYICFGVRGIDGGLGGSWHQMSKWGIPL